MTIHREGFRTIGITALIFGIINLISISYLGTCCPRIAGTIFGLTLFFFLFIISFFRIPNRTLTINDNQIICPADGKVVVIEEVFEEEYFKDKRLQVSIFMSPINVHVTRYAASGKIKFSKYHPGKYLVAWHPKASTENERTTVVIETEAFGEILYRQIAGALARRIVNYAEEGQEVTQGDDAGFIKFGSRVDIYLPLGTKVDVKLQQKAVGNQTVIVSK